MKKIFDKLIAALCIASIATSAIAVKINAPADINNFGPAVVSAMSGLYVSPSRQILTSSPLSGGGDLTADRTISLGTLGTAGTYGDATHTNVITTDTYGRISAITPTTITNVSGNAATATALATGRTISITGDLAYTSPSFDGSGNVTAAGTLATVNSNVGACGDATHVGVVTLNGKGLTTACTATTITGVPASTAVTLATPRTIAIQTGDVTSPGASFDGSASETAATTLATVNANTGACGSATQSSVITLNAKGLATACTSTTITNTTGNSATATALATSRTIAILTGDVTSPGAGFTGAANETAAATLATVNSNTGTFGSASAVPNITVNGKGLITAVTTSALGTAATQNTGTSGATIPFLNGTNTWSGINTYSNTAIFSGSVAIGRATPSTTLDVNGNISVADGAFVYTGYNGSTNTGTVRAGFQMDGTNQAVSFYTANTFHGKIDSSGNLSVSGNVTATLASDAASTDNTVCILSTGEFRKGSGTLGVCLGTSSARYKRDIVPLAPGLPEIMKLKPKSFFYRKGHGDDGAKEQYGLIAEEVLPVLPKLTSLDDRGRANSVDLVGMIPVLIKAVQDQQAEIAALKKQISKLTH